MKNLDELFGEVITITKNIECMGCDDSNCNGYSDCNQCNPDDG